MESVARATPSYPIIQPVSLCITTVNLHFLPQHRNIHLEAHNYLQQKYLFNVQASKMQS